MNRLDPTYGFHICKSIEYTLYNVFNKRTYMYLIYQDCIVIDCDRL